MRTEIRPVPRSVRRGLCVAAAAASLLAAAASPAASLAAGPAVTSTVRAVVHTRASGPDLVTVAFTDARHGWMAGPGVILATSNSGATWRRQYAGHASIQALDAVDAAHVWALSANGLLATSDGGSHWVPRSEPAGGTGLLQQVQFVSTTVGWGLTGPAYGPAKHLVRTANGGASWARAAMPSATTSVCFTNASDGWAATGYGPGNAAVYRTTDGAGHWSRVLSPSGAFGARLACSGAAAWVLALGGSGMSSTAYSVYYTPGGGRKWTRVLATSTAGGGPAPGGSKNAPSGPGSSPGPMSAVGGRTLAFFGACEACDGAGTLQLALTTDGGQSWREGLPIGGVTVIGSTVASFVSASHGWLLGHLGQARPVLLRTVDGGATWKQQYPTTAPSPLYAISFVSARVGFGLGTAGDSGAVLRTTDGGRHWTRVGGLVGAISPTVGLSFVNAMDGWAVAGGGGLVHTIDGGRTWSGVPVYAAPRAGAPAVNVGAVYDVAFVNAHVGCLRSLPSNLLYGTVDGGGTWRVQPTSPSAWMCAAHLAGTLPAAMGRASERPPAAGGQYAGSGGKGRFTWVWTGSALYTSTDGGVHWTYVALPNEPLSNFFFADASHGWSLLWDGRLYATTDGGAQWSEMR